MEHQLHIRLPDQRCQKSALEVARQCGHRPDPQHLALLPFTLAQRRHQRVAGITDRVRIPQCNAARLGQQQRLPLTHEQWLTKLPLQQPDLRRQRRRRHVQRPRRPRQVALVRHRPEILQMVVIQP